MATTPSPMPSADIGTLISKTPGLRGGSACIAGTGASVMRVAGWYKLGWIPEEIARRMDLTLAQVHAAIAYYHTNQAEIEADLAEERALDEKYAEEHNSDKA